MSMEALLAKKCKCKIRPEVDFDFYISSTVCLMLMRCRIWSKQRSLNLSTCLMQKIRIHCLNRIKMMSIIQSQESLNQSDDEAPESDMVDSEDPMPGPSTDTTEPPKKVSLIFLYQQSIYRWLFLSTFLPSYFLFFTAVRRS